MVPSRTDYVKKYAFNIACWNINGLTNEKMNDEEFRLLISKFDCVILLKTFQLKCDNIKDYYTFCLPAKKVSARGRPMGGTVIVTKPETRKLMSILKSKCETFCWLKFTKEKLNLDKGLFVCAAYIPPIDSSSRRNQNQNDKYEQFDILQEENLYYSTFGETIIMGDLNARVGNISDILLTYDKLENVTVDNNEYIYKNINNEIRARNIRDNIVNQYGKRICEICRQSENGLHILNGRTVGDLNGQFTCFRPNGRSTVDLALVNYDLLHHLRYFKVHLPSLLSDHSPISLSLKCHQNHMIISTEAGESAPLGFRWDPHCTDAFKAALKLPEIKLP